MKIRNGFVSNSSSSSFTCDICGQNYDGWDASPYDGQFECSVCIYEHIMCNEHLKCDPEVALNAKGCEHEFDRDKEEECPECGEPAWVEDGDNRLSEKCCPICQFDVYSESEMAKYLEKTKGISRDEVFATVKAVNKRRKKLYDAEYVTYVCQKFNTTDDAMLKEIKEKFVTFENYYKFLNGTE